MKTIYFIKAVLKILLITFLIGPVGVGITADGESEKMKHPKLAALIKQHLASAYPNIKIEIRPWIEDKSRLAIYFTEEKFANLYPMQRYHYLIHNLPDDFIEKYLSNSVWFELAPGEKPDELKYPDENMIRAITPDVMKILNKAKFFNALDDLMAPEDTSQKGLPCHGDFRLTKQVLKQKGFTEGGQIDEIFDICHVLMSEGAFCDCEVLYNVSENNRLKSRYWKKRAKEKGGAQQGHSR